MEFEKDLTIADLEKLTLKDLYAYARQYKIPYYSKMNKKELAMAVIRAQAEEVGYFQMSGVLDMAVQQDGYGFLRPINYGSSQEDIYISASQIRRFGLRNGDRVTGKARPPKTNERYYSLMYVEQVNGKSPEEAKSRPHFPALTALYPEKKIDLAANSGTIAQRMIDLFAPIGYGQRGLIVAPPKAGKTTLLKQIAAGITKNNPKAKLIVLLIDERPEEVTDLERTINGEVVYSTFDQKPENHIKVAELVLERARRLVEDHQDVVILLDSLTRLARAYNLVIPASGRTLSGGLEPGALYKPKKFFGSARNIEEGGSLTILATALVDTGSRMDDMIYEEFKGTGNQELHLSRELAEHRVFPAINIKRSGTRKEDLLLTPEELTTAWKVRKNLSGQIVRDTEQIIQLMQKTTDNAAFC